MSDTTRMLAATYRQGGELSVEEVPVPVIRRDEILLRVRAASICGTDVKIVRFGHRKLADGQRIVLGHEFVGVIEQLGSDVLGYRLGQRVGVAPNAGCGNCDACIRGTTNYCPQYTALGIDRDGGQAPLVRIPGCFVRQGNVLPLPDEVSDVQAALLEPFSCVVNAVRASQIELGDTVVIFGAGPMGLMHGMLCRIAGAARIIVVDPLEHRRQKARQVGCDDALDPGVGDLDARLRAETGGRGVDVVITACPVPEVQTQAVRLLAPLGRLCLFGGLPKGAGPVPMDTNAVHYGNLVVTGTTGGSVRDYRVAMRLVAGRRVDLGQVVSDVFPLSQLRAAYDLALSGAEGKVILIEEAS
jgi:L-iditol 2-dehydrogenase